MGQSPGLRGSLATAGPERVALQLCDSFVMTQFRYQLAMVEQHAAAADEHRDVAMTHIALQEELDGSAVTWMEHVTDAQYAQT